MKKLLTIIIVLITYNISYSLSSPTLSYPTNNSTPWTGVTLDWYAVSGMVSGNQYELQVATDNSFSNIIFTKTEDYINSASSNSDTEEYLDDLYFGTTYYWRVRTIVSGTPETWSSVWDFTTRDYVTLYYPDNEASTYTGVTIDWYAHYGVDAYQYQVDTVNTFDSNVLIEGQNDYINSSSGNSDTEKYLEDLYFGTKYYWRVRAINAVDASDWLTVRTFTTRDYVPLVSPSDGALNISTSGENLNWNAHYGVDYYYLEIDTTNQFNSGDLQEITKAYINTSSGNSDTYQNTGILDDNTIYFWRVRASNAVDTSAWTMRWFSTGNAPLDLPEIPTLLSPANNAVEQATSFTFDWEDANNAISYVLEYAENNQFTDAIQETSAISEFSVSNLDVDKTYYWRIYSSDGTNISEWSEIWNFNTNVATTDRPILTSPTDGATDISTSPTLDWEAVTGATMYEYQYTTNSSFATYINDYVSGTEAPLSGLNNNYTYYWRVRAFDDTDWSDWSEIWSFTTEATGSGLSAPTLISPTNGAIDQPTSLTLLWNIVPSANEYEYQYSTDETFATYTSETTQSSSISIGVLNYNTEYFWRIQATDGTNYSEWSEVWSFTTEGAGYELETPILISPANGAINQEINLTLSWNEVTSATEYEAQYSTDNTFATYSNATTSDTTISISGLNYNTQYFWRIQATDGTILSEWSEIWSFTTKTDLSTDENLTDNIKIYPNPATDYISLNFSELNKDLSVEIINMQGKIVYSEKYNNNKINISNLTSGIYLIRIKNENLQIKKSVFIKK